MFFSSIRFKIVLWYMLLLTITLLSFSAVLYGSFVKNLYDDFDDLLNSRADGVVNAINTYYETKGSAPKDDFALSAIDWVEEKRKDPQLMSIFVRILSPDGEPIVSSKSMPRIAPIPKDGLEDILNGEDSFDTIIGESQDRKRIKFRSYAEPVIEKGKVRYIVQVTGPMGLVTIALKSLVVILFILLPLTVLLAAAPGVVLARVTLRPVDRMIDTLRQITAENLKLKIHIPDTKDEIKRLADTFNEMIGRLDKSFSSQQNFIQDIAVELKAPLLNLKAEFETAVNEKRSVEEYKEMLRRGLREMGNVSKTIETLLLLARFDNSQVALEIKKVNLTRLLGEVVRDIKTTAEEKDIILSSFLQETIILDGDENQIKQIFSSLLDNAIKYTRRKGRVTVTAHRAGLYAKVAVSDTGAGIPDDELVYIFDRFYQVNKSRAGNGFGLGLSIAKSIAESHKGAISVESQEGKGSIFTVTLPLSYPG